MKKLILGLLLAAFAVSTIPLISSTSADAGDCKYTRNSGKSSWSC